MPTKPSIHPLAVRFSGEDRAFLKAFQDQLALTMPGATLSDAVKVLVQAGRQALSPPAEGSERFLAALRGVDPSWSGKKPALRKAGGLRLPDGTDPVALVMARRKARG